LYLIKYVKWYTITLMNVLGIRPEYGNDSPRGGRMGDYIGIPRNRRTKVKECLAIISGLVYQPDARLYLIKSVAPMRCSKAL